MKLLYTLLTPIVLLSALSKTVTAQEFKTIYLPNVLPKNMNSQVKKKRFFYLIAPSVQKVNAELQRKYLRIKKDIKKKTNAQEIAKLKKEYRVKTDLELLKALKPHPPRIVIAQAAMESSWATSRFFVQAYNVFGMWSSNPNEPRIAASQKRGGTRTIWLRKFDTVEASIRAYYMLMSKGKAFKEFRTLRLKTDNSYELVKKLDKYSEIGAKYGKELAQVIRYNKLERYNK